MKLFEFDANIGDWRTLIQTRDIQNGAVRSQHIAGDAVTGDKIAGGEIKSRHIADDAVTGDKIADGTIPGSKLTEGCITGDKIVGGTVKQGKLADNAVSERNIQPHSVTGGKIADGAIRPVHVPQETILHITKDVQNQIDGIQIAGVAVSNEFGNDPHIALSQKKVTEAILGQQEAIDELENSVGEGGSVDTRIEQAKSDIIGDAGTGYDTLKKVQDRITEERTARQSHEENVYTKSQTYSKSELNNLITTPEQNYVTVEATNETTSISSVLPATGAANTVYRVGSWDGTQYAEDVYTEYAWDGSHYVPLATKNVGFDEGPTDGSTKLLSSGRIFKFMEDKESTATNPAAQMKYTLTDYIGNLIAAVLPDDKYKMYLDLLVDNINNMPAPKITSNENFKILFLDGEDNVIFGIDKNNKIVCPLFDTSILYGESDQYVRPHNTIYDRQKHLEPILLNDCLYDYNPSYNQHEDLTQNSLRKKRLQLAVVTDTHLMDDTFRAGVDAASEFVSIDATLQLGDMCNWVDPDNDTYDKTKAIIDAAQKPLFITPGNHDAGTRTQYVRYCKDDIQLYNRFVKPAVDKGWLKPANPLFTYKSNGEDVAFPKVAEYQENKVYYYHDFDEFKVRLIMLYSYDDGNVFDETYWTPVSYNASYPNISVKQYVTGDKINVPGYDTYSFRAVQNVNVTLISKSFAAQDEAFDRNPRFKALRRGAWYGQAQLDWLCERLEEAGEHGYMCLICQHYALINRNVTFDTTTRWQNPYHLAAGSYEFRYSDEDKNIISQIVNAYQTQGTIQKTLHANATTQTGDAGGYDDTSDIPDVVLDKTFSHSGKVLFLHGHNHRDNIARSNIFDQMGIGFISGTLYDVYPIDVRRSLDDAGKDSVNCVTVYQDGEQGFVHLTRLGNTLTSRIDPNTHQLIRKDNEVLTF